MEQGNYFHMRRKPYVKILYWQFENGFLIYIPESWSFEMKIFILGVGACSALGKFLLFKITTLEVSKMAERRDAHSTKAPS